MSSALAVLPIGSVAALLAGLAVLTWPGGHPARAQRLLAELARSDGPTVPKAIAARADSSSAEGLGGAAHAIALAPDLLMELVAAGLRGGLSVVDALSCAVSAGGRPAGSSSPSGRPWSPRGRGGRRPRDDPTAYLAVVVSRLRAGVSADQAWLDPPVELDLLARAMVLAELSGAPAAGIVARAARDARTRARERVELDAARLGVRLVLPLGLTVLPGFVLLAVAPIVLGLAAAVLRSGG